jgi:hypothetical protein
MTKLVSFALGAILVACASTELPGHGAHPANPRAAQAHLPALPPTLAPCFDPFDGHTPHESVREGHDHAHDHGAEHAAVYTCPMHPEVQAQEPGRCPKCGMKLEPRQDEP